MGELGIPELFVIVALALLFVGYIIYRLVDDKHRGGEPLIVSRSSKESKDSEDSGVIRINISDYLPEDFNLLDSLEKVRQSDDWIELDSIKFYGRIESRSANGRYAVASRDRWSHGENTDGSVVLLSGSKVIYHKHFERPHDVKVADNGTVIVNDWLFSDNPDGIFYVYDLDGKRVLMQRFKANLHGNAISNSGRYALCSTACSDYDPHNMVTFLYDLQSGEVVSIIEYATYENRIDEEARLIHMDESKIHLIFNFEGECVQGYGPTNPTWYAHCRGYDLYEAYAAELAEAEPGFTTFEEYQPYIEHFQEAIRRIASENWKAKIYLQIGDIYAKFKMVDEARACYNAATKENPKAAVTRRLQRLDKIIKTGVEEGERAK